MNKTDFIIVGQGIAGTLLAHFLQKAGRSVLVIDDGYERASSKVAAGIINPVTGRHYVKSWMIDELLPAARSTYRELESELGVPLYREMNVLRALFSHGEENDWLARCADPAYQPYLTANPEPGIYSAVTEPAFRYGGIRESAQVNVPLLVRAYRQKLELEGALIQEVFDYAALEWFEDGVRYKAIEAGKILFCEGAKGAQNPWFGHLPLQGNKGEVLHIQMAGQAPGQILKHRIFIVPLPAGDYWIGSTSDNRFEDDMPTAKGRDYLKNHLRNLVTVPFEIREHRAALRPTVKDRRPLLGMHPEYPQLGIFNGLGTKGTSLGPYWAQAMADLLIQGRPIPVQVDHCRFNPDV